MFLVLYNGGGKLDPAYNGECIPDIEIQCEREREAQYDLYIHKIIPTGLLEE